LFIEHLKKHYHYVKMTKQLPKLKMIHDNKSIVFCSPLEDKNDVFVRTGTISDESFYHALLHAYSSDYTLMDTRDRKKFVKRLRASLAGKIDKESWEGIGGGLIAKIPFQEKIQFILLNFYRFMDSDENAQGKSTRTVIKSLIDDDESKLEYIRLITELLPLNVFEKQILPKAYKKCIDSKIMDCKIYIKKLVHEQLKEHKDLNDLKTSRMKYIYSIASEMITVIMDEAENSTFKEYASNFKNVTEEVDLFTTSLISERFDRDIYFMDGHTRLPCQNTHKDNLKDRKSIIVLYIGNNHYEIVGRLLSGTRIQREFSYNDPIIKKMKALLYNHNLIHEKYPELSEYIPDGSCENNPLSHNSDNNDSDNDSDSDSDSDNSRSSGGETDCSETDSDRKISPRA
jgi:hypothetical protein